MRRPSFRSFNPLSALTFFVLPLVALAMVQPARGDKDLTVKLPAAGEYQVWLEAETASGSQAQAPERVTGDRASLPLPAAPSGLKEWRVLALDEKTGYVAIQTLPAKNAPGELSLTAPEFNRVHRVRVQVTGAGSKPVAGASVTLTDAKGSTLSKVIDGSAAGVAEFIDVASGTAKLTVTPTGGKSTTKDVDINLPKGETTDQIAVPLPEVTAVVEAPTNVPPAGAPAASGEKPGEGKSTTGMAGTPEGTGTAVNPPAPAPAPAPTPSGGGLGSFVGLILVLGVVGYAFLHLKNQGWTLDKFLARLSEQSTAVSPAGTGLGSSAPPPPPVDPNVCPFCGQRKDPVTGACACSLDVPAAGGSLAGPAMATTGTGPRLVAVSGLAMGQIFPISGEATIGRDPGNTVSLSMDSTVSRRHAVIGPSDGGFVIQDQGSSNGTFVNGAKVTEAPLRPGDELSIGGTRFRFEA